MLNNVLTIAQETAIVAQDAPAWVQGLVAVLSIVITAFLLPWLKQRAIAAREEAAANRVSADNGKLDTKRLLISMLTDYLFDAAASIVEKEFPKIAKAVQAGELKTAGSIKLVLKGLGTDLKAVAIAHFDEQGVDLVASLGDDYIDALIRRIADRVSPFPGRDSAVSFLTDNLTDTLIKKGANYVRKLLVREDNGGTIVEVPVTLTPEA